MFYDQFKSLCEKRNERPYSVLREIGVKNTHVIVQWQKGSTPRQPTLEKIAEYFGVSIDYLLTGEEKQPSVPEGLSEIARRIAEIVDRLPPELRRIALSDVQGLERAAQDPAFSEGSQE